MLTHGNMLSNARAQDYWGWVGDVLLHALPIFHVHGLFVASHGALLNGSRMIWFGEVRPAAVVKRLPRPAVFMGVPTLYVRTGGSPRWREACRNMRLFIAGSAPLLIRDLQKFRAQRPTILERYGMSEVMLTSSPYHAKGRRARRGDTDGLPALPGVGLRVADDRGSLCPSGEIGGIGSRAERLQGLLAHAEKTTDEFTTDRLVQDRRRGQHRRRRLRHHRRPQQGTLMIITGGYSVYRPRSGAASTDGRRGRTGGDRRCMPISAKAWWRWWWSAQPGATPDAAALIRRAEAADRQLQRCAKHCFVVDALPQHHGQGAEEPAARRTRGCSWLSRSRQFALPAAAAPSTAVRTTPDAGPCACTTLR